MSQADSKRTTSDLGEDPVHKSPTFDRPPRGWFILEVMRKHERKRDWVALMTDVEPENLQEMFRTGRTTRECWVLIPGKHGSREAAWEALGDMMATRH